MSDDHSWRRSAAATSSQSSTKYWGARPCNDCKRERSSLTLYAGELVTNAAAEGLGRCDRVSGYRQRDAPQRYEPPVLVVPGRRRCPKTVSCSSPGVRIQTPKSLSWRYLWSRNGRLVWVDEAGKRCTANRADLSRHGEVAVEYNAQVAHTVHYWDNCWRDLNAVDSDPHNVLFCTESHDDCLRWIKAEAASAQPLRIQVVL